MQKTSTAMFQRLSTLDSEARILTLLSEERGKDSKAMKALTSVATLYLPASLIATIFQSNLVQLLPTSSPPQPSHFVVAPQPWLPIVATISLMALTLALVRLLDTLNKHVEGRRLKVQSPQANTVDVNIAS